MGSSIKTAVALADNTRRLMEQLGWSQGELGRRAGLSQRAVGYVLNYRDDRDRHASLETVELLAGAFKVTPAELISTVTSGALAHNLLVFPQRQQPKRDGRRAKSESQGVDLDLLTAVLEGVMHLQSKLKGTPKQKALLISSVYDLLASSAEESRSPDNIVRLLRSA